ncbi:MAG: hypothetical protein AB9M60_00145 [Leptothrix sp. (in: b-proteobacteria)]
MNELAVLQAASAGLGNAGALGLVLPSPAELIGSLLFGLIGWAAWRSGRRRQQPATWGLGLALMVYPYAVSGTAMLYAIGVALCVALWVVEKRASGG